MLNCFAWKSKEKYPPHTFLSHLWPVTWMCWVTAADCYLVITSFSSTGASGNWAVHILYRAAVSFPVWLPDFKIGNIRIFFLAHSDSLTRVLFFIYTFPTSWTATHLQTGFYRVTRALFGCTLPSCILSLLACKQLRQPPKMFPGFIVAPAGKYKNLFTASWWPCEPGFLFI